MALTCCRCCRRRGCGRETRLRAVSPAGVQIAVGVVSAPNNHLAARPDCCVRTRAAGAFVVLVAIQVSVPGLYLPPGVENSAVVSTAPDNHFDCRSKLQCASYRAAGALVVLVAVQLSMLRLYLPPVLK